MATSYSGLTVPEILVYMWILISNLQNTSLKLYKLVTAELCFHTRSPEALVKVFCTYVRPILEYCTPVWSPHHIGLVDKIKKVQRRFTKRIFCLSNLSYKDRLLLLKLDFLHVRRIKQDLIICHKNINGLVAIDCSEFFSITDCDSTRGHNLKLYIQNCRLDVRKFSFARRVCPVWNTLS